MHKAAGNRSVDLLVSVDRIWEHNINDLRFRPQLSWDSRKPASLRTSTRSGSTPSTGPSSPYSTARTGEFTAEFLASHVDRIHQHFQNYYTALDEAAILSPHRNLPLLLHPPWLSPLQVPLLFLGDLHPFLFTTLLRSFVLDRDNNDEDDAEFDEDGSGSDSKRSSPGVIPDPDVQGRIATAWRRPSGVLISRMDEMERWVRLMVPEVTNRVRAAQQRLGERLGKRMGEDGVGEAAEGEMKEMVTAFVEANRMRRSVVAEIASATDAYQGASYFKALGQFIVGLRDKKVVDKLEQCMIMLR